MRFVFIALLSAIALAGEPVNAFAADRSAASGCEGERRVLSVADALGTTRFLLDQDGQINRANVSPSRERFAVLMLDSDVANNRNRLRILSGALTNLAAARNARVVRSLFSRSYGRGVGYGP